MTLTPKQHLNIICFLYLLVGIMIGFLLTTQLTCGQTYSRTNLSITLDKQHQSIDTTGEYSKLVIQLRECNELTSTASKPKTQHTMTFQVTILDYKPNKWFYLLLICIDQPMDSLKIHTFQGSELYNNLLFMCETIYGYYDIVGDDYIGTLDEELFTLNLQQCKQQQILSVGE